MTYLTDIQPPLLLFFTNWKAKYFNWHSGVLKEATWWLWVFMKNYNPLELKIFLFYHPKNATGGKYNSVDYNFFA